MRWSRCTSASRPRRPTKCSASTSRRALLERALADAEPDGFALPFAENFRYLEPLLTERLEGGLTGRIVRLGGLAGQRRAAAERPAVLAALTERECAIVGLMTQRLSNREIAEKL